MPPKLPRAALKYPSHSSFSSARLTRLLTALADTDIPVSRQSLGERLGSWLDWADAISLSAALNESPSAPVTGLGLALPWTAAQAGAALDRVRAELAHAILTDKQFAPAPSSSATPRRPASDDSSLPHPDGHAFAPYRRACAAHQRAMESAIAPLRQAVRQSLTASAALGPLASLDAALEGLLGLRERSLLATIPGLLEKRFKRLQKIAETAAPGMPVAAAGDWQYKFREDIQDVLIAELEIRLLPVQGMLAALDKPKDESQARLPGEVFTAPSMTRQA